MQRMPRKVRISPQKGAWLQKSQYRLDSTLTTMMEPRGGPTSAYAIVPVQNWRRTPDAAPPGAVRPSEDGPHEQVDVHRHVEEVRLLHVERPMFALRSSR
jgi:hypothetical protein